MLVTAMGQITALSQHQLLMWVAYVAVKSSVAAIWLVIVYRMLGHTSPGFKDFMVRMASEGSEPSTSRTLTVFVTFSCILMDAYLVAVNHVFPDVGGQVMLIGTLYGLNVAAATASKFSKMSGESSSSTTTSSSTVVTGGTPKP
jgi:hypothetical protein